MRTALVLLACLAACDGDDPDPPIDAPVVDSQIVDTMPADAEVIDTPPAVVLTLTSTAFNEGGVIPDMYSCQGTNVSPPLVWTGPAAPGFALIFTDITSTANPFLHSIIWDIPGDTSALPENVEKVYMPPVPLGSKQPLGYNNTTRGYLGPCPGSMHRYEYTLYAVDVYPLPGLDMQSSRTTVRTTILAHDTARGTLTATFTP